LTLEHVYVGVVEVVVAFCFAGGFGVCWMVRKSVGSKLPTALSGPSRACSPAVFVARRVVLLAWRRRTLEQLGGSFGTYGKRFRIQPIGGCETYFVS
jgi:hypothetical protein